MAVCSGIHCHSLIYQRSESSEGRRGEDCKAEVLFFYQLQKKDISLKRY